MIERYTNGHYEESEKTINFDHPILDRGQLVTVFSYLRSGADISALEEDQELWNSFIEEDKRKFKRVIETNADIESVLASCNMRLVRAIASVFSRVAPISMGDALSSGGAGLAQAVRGFDHERGGMFTPYAAVAIRREISRAIRNGIPTSSRDMHRNLQIVRQVRHAFLDVFNRDASNDELESQLLANTEFSPRTVKRLIATIDGISVASMESAIRTDRKRRGSDERLLKDQIIDESVDIAMTVERNEEKDETSNTVENALFHLSNEEVVVIRGLYGIGEDTQSARELAALLGLTEKQIIELHLGALAKLHQDSNLRAKTLGTVIPVKTEQTEIDQSVIDRLPKKERKKEMVRILKLSGHYTRYQIAEIVGLTPQGVSFNVKKLIEEGKLAVSPLEALWVPVGILRNEGLYNDEIAERLDVEKGVIARIANSLTKRGEIEPIPVREKRLKAAAVSEETRLVKAHLDAQPPYVYRDMELFFHKKRV